ncbi:MAG: hypothetical protein K0S12_191 [Bacteroidetes bacterium]|jgi:hypothetical protein|nr:hypothetical protein [Bacteroidota bacterium]
MKNILYFIAVVLTIIWAISHFAYNAGYLIHIVLIVAVISLLFRIMDRKTILITKK